MRRRDWLRPLWIVGMLLYMYVEAGNTVQKLQTATVYLTPCYGYSLSQLIGSTLALEYMRAGGSQLYIVDGSWTDG